MAALLCAPPAFAGGGPSAPPFFTTASPESVYVDLNAGQTSFECTGTAVDLNPNDTVYFLAPGRRPFMSFDQVPGNPGTFRLHAENLTGANYGGYIVDVIATDSLTTINGNSVRFVISIVPEPTGFCVLAAFPLVNRRRRFA